MFQVDTQWGQALYGTRLIQSDEGKYQWTLCLHRVNGVDVTNRGWRAVGPTFVKSSVAGMHLGIGEGGKVSRTAKDVSAHLQDLVKEYNASYINEPQVRHERMESTM